MVRQARIVVPGYPHHVIQRGNRRQTTFFGDEDYRAYLDYLVEWSGKAGTEIWAYCLMPNHVHLILVPSQEDGLRAALGETHRRYARRINRREDWTGHLWQGRFSSYVMDEPYLLTCARYIERNPVEAGLVRSPGAWKWSSAKAHLSGEDDGVARVKPLLKLVPGWKAFLAGRPDGTALDTMVANERSAHPLGGKMFFQAIEKQLGRSIQPGKRGRPRKNQ